MERDDLSAREQIPHEQIVGACTDPILTVNHDGRMVFVNDAARRWLGLDAPAESKDHGSFWDRIAPEDRERLRASLANGPAVLDDVEVASLRNDEQRVEITMIVHDDAGDPAFSVIARLTASDAVAQASFRIDRLTGVATRETIIERADHCKRRVERTGERYALLFCDLDGFKLVNDLLGHETGDAVLVEVGSRIERTVRPYDTVARFGGDEFVILLEDVLDSSTATAVGQRIVAAIAETIEIGEIHATVGISIGVSVSEPGLDSEALLRRADVAMYEAKHLGKNRVEVFDRALDRRLSLQRELGADLRRALASDEFVLWYRPVVSLVTGEIASLEASVHWNHPTRGHLGPTDFVSIAGTTGLIEHIDRWVMTAAASDVAAWRSEKPELVAWVTLSGRLLASDDAAEHILAILQAVRADSRTIGIEVGEDAVVSNFTATLPTLRKLRNGGVHLALDNFSGRLSIPQLQQIQPDAVKLERSLVQRVGQDSYAARTLRSLVGMIRPLGIDIVAKGVGSESQLGAVISLNCDHAQGDAISELQHPSNLSFQRLQLGRKELEARV